MIQFHKSFTQQEPLPEASMQMALEVMQTGRLHRYNTVPGETSQTALLEKEFADYMGIRYCVACASGGYALQLALRSLGVGAGDRVLTNAFTLSPVPGAIHSVAAEPILVETADDYKIDLDDLDKAAASSGARYLLLSHMRGHIVDMQAVGAICQTHGLSLIEDCAHTMGAHWKQRPSGSFGHVACFSTQTYKHINSGEGGLLVSDDAELIKRAIIHSGSYMLYGDHIAAPPATEFEPMRLHAANYSGRLDNLRAAILRPQLRALDGQCERWNRRWHALAVKLRQVPAIHLPQRPQHEGFVGSSIQFSLPACNDAQIRQFIDACNQRGVSVKWFGDAEPKGYTSRHDSWLYLRTKRDLPNTSRVLATLCDMRIPLTFDIADCQLIADAIAEAAMAITSS